jgi:hypothetical protein
MIGILLVAAAAVLALVGFCARAAGVGRRAAGAEGASGDASTCGSERIGGRGNWLARSILPLIFECDLLRTRPVFLSPFSLLPRGRLCVLRC